MYRVFWLRRVLRSLFHDRVLPTRAESGKWLWYRPAEYPSLLRGVSRFEPVELARWRTLLRPGDVIYDVGANIGITAHRFHGILNGRCTIVAFEPLPRNLALLERNARALDGAASVIPCAVGDREGSAQFRDNLQHGALSMLADLTTPPDPRFWEEQQTVNVAMTTLDAVIHSGQRAPSFVKIDVEGGGHLVLQGAAEMLAVARPILSISLHNKVEGDGVQAVLARAGYRGVRFGSDGSTAQCELAEAESAYVHPDSATAARIGAAKLRE
jgi:FkbM family methyltransferase